MAQPVYGVIVNIDVPSIADGVAFYENGLGFSLHRRLFGGAVAELRTNATSLFLIEQPSGSKPFDAADTARDYADHWTPVHLDLPVDDLDAALERAIAAGARPAASASVAVYGRLAPLRDPFGHGFCLIEFSAAGYDAVESDRRGDGTVRRT